MFHMIFLCSMADYVIPKGIQKVSDVVVYCTLFPTHRVIFTTTTLSVLSSLPITTNTWAAAPVDTMTDGR